MAGPILVPGAEAYILDDPVSTKPIAALHWILCHTIVGTVDSALPGKHYHLYVRGNGNFIQRQDLALRSAASVDANPYSIAIVCEDKGSGFPSWSGSNVPPYTPEQVDTLIVVLSWICHRFGLSTSAIRTTCLNDANGIGWHRLGIDGDFPDEWPYWGRQPGCLETSLSEGKPCPGDNRIDQVVNDIVPAVSGGEDMAFSEEQIIDMVMRGVRRELRDEPENTARQGILELINRGVDQRFSTSGSDTRSQLVGTKEGVEPKVTGLVDLGLERSATFQALEDKVDHIIEMLHPDR
jgi:N-acetylmuramoyl-L-alanine amidase